MKTAFYIILLLITLISCSKETMQNNAIEEPIFENVIYLDFNGGQLQSNSWNNGNEMYLQPSGLSGNDQRKVLDKVGGYFSQFKVTVTDQESVYLQANAASRQRVILTTTYQWYGGPEIPGTAILGSFGEDIPAFIFTPARYFNPEALSIVAAHEIGHSLNLYHQSEYDSSNCKKVNEHRDGSIMGVTLSANSDHWTVGQSSKGCNDIQDDVKQMAQILSFK